MLWFCLAAALATSPSITFFGLGDWGLRNDDQKAVAVQLDKSALTYRPNFLISLGDNFYEKGVSSDDDIQWNLTYRDVYVGEGLEGVPWYAILGNHDYRENPEAQILYWKHKRDTRWIMMDRFYNQSFASCLMESNRLNCLHVDVFFLDTVILAPEEDHDLSVPADALTREKEQLEWLEHGLESSRADWKIVAGHYPVYSAGEHGDQVTMQKKVLPLLEKYGVHLYLCGHVHTMQHLHRKKSTANLEFMVSGNGAKRGKIVRPENVQAEIKFAKVDPAFSIHTLTQSSMHTRFIDKDGQEIYSYIQPREIATRIFPNHSWGPGQVVGLIFGIILAVSACVVFLLTYLRSRNHGYNRFSHDSATDTDSQMMERVGPLSPMTPSP